MCRVDWRKMSVAVVAATSVMAAAALCRAQSETNDKTLHEPVFRVGMLPENPATDSVPTPPAVAPAGPADPASATPQPSATAAPTTAHPLDPAIDLARTTLTDIRAQLLDYQAIMVKREWIDGELREPEFMKVKVRNRRVINERPVPFSVYMRFLKPKSIRGREVIYVEGQNSGKLLAHEIPGSLKNIMTVRLDPTGWMAMQNSRHPIYEAGIENLVCKLIEKAERDKAVGLCEVEFSDSAKINDRACTKITVTHQDQRPPFDFHKAEVFIDQELKLPVRYAAYLWPTATQPEPQLLEEYTYLNVETNVGLTDVDFDPNNPDYDFP